MMPEVITKAAADILHEVVLGGVVDATAEVAARSRVGNVETRAGNADAAEEIEAEFFADLGLKECIEVGENRPIGFIAKIAGLAGAPRGFDIEAETMLEADNVSSDAEIGPTFFGEITDCQRTVAGRGGHERAAEEHNVTLLGGGEVARKQ